MGVVANRVSKRVKRCSDLYVPRVEAASEAQKKGVAVKENLVMLRKEPNNKNSVQMNIFNDRRSNTEVFIPRREMRSISRRGPIDFSSYFTCLRKRTLKKKVT